MIATKKNFCVSISFVLQRCQPRPPLPDKKTPEQVGLPLGNPRHLSISAALVFPFQGMPRVAALPPIFWLPLLSAVCAQLNNTQEVEDNACIQVLPLVMSESVQSFSSFHFNGSLIFHSIAKIRVNLWGLGKGDVLKDGCRGSPFYPDTGLFCLEGLWATLYLFSFPGHLVSSDKVLLSRCP